MQSHHIIINRQQRDYEKFDLLDLYDAIGRDKKYVLGDKKDEAAFIDTIKNALSVNKTPTMIYGRRVEAMFSYMAASLGKCALVKKEDCGDVFVSDAGIKIPDYRIVINGASNEQILVEVKNYHQKDTFNEYHMNACYLDALSRYADLVKIDLRIAIYWSKWCLWTLVNPNDFGRNGTKAIISLSTAMKRNQMSSIGDVMIGTTPPLTFRIYPDKQLSHIVSNNFAEFTIGNIKLFCNNNPITIKSEQQIAFALMLHGDWEESSTIITSYNSENEIEYIEFSFSPYQDDNQQNDHQHDFYIVNALSTIISRQYGQLTALDGKVQRFSPAIAPGLLGFVIPEDYNGKALPLWIFHFEPNYE